MIKTLAIRSLWMLLGYALAVLVATTLVCVMMGIPSLLPDHGAMGSFYRYLQDFPSMFAFGTLMTALYGLPGWLISVVYAEWRNVRHRVWFAIAGFLNGGLAILLSNNGRFYTGDFILTSAIFIGGLAGGLAYWALAGKKSGNWKVAI